MGFSFQIITYGCKVNQYESQSIREHWVAIGGEEITQKNSKRKSKKYKQENIDLILIAGCALTAQGISGTYCIKIPLNFLLI